MSQDSSGQRRRPTPREKIVPVQVISPLISLAFEKGWSGREMFPFVDFVDVGAAAPGQVVCYADCHEAFLRARHRLGESFPIDYAGRKSLAFLGVIGLGMMVQRTVGEALRYLLDFATLAGSVLVLDWEREGEEEAIVAQDLFGGHELTSFWLVDHLATIAGLTAQLPCDDARPLRLELEGALPEPTRIVLSLAIGCPIVAPAERSRLVYGAATLCKPLRFPDAAASAHWRRAGEIEQARFVLPGAGSQVRRIIAVEGRLVGREEVSRELGVSERSLARRLAREGASFSQLTSASRLETAKELLLSGATVDAAAERLGYSDARSFRRAFKRLTGISPLTFRSST